MFQFSKTILVVFVAAILVRMVAGSLVPIIQDEAYYFLWARHLDWGYFDHPPGVAFVAQTALWAQNLFLQRWGAIFVGGVGVVLLAFLYKEAGLNKTGRLPIAITLATLSVAGIAGGFLVAPDSLMILAWIGALWAAARALNIDPKWWLAAGVFTGIGLLSKYVMVIIGPIFLWGLIRGAPQQLRSPWPYLGGVIALLIFLPHLNWNAQNDWVTFRFQLLHGLANSHDIQEENRDELPIAQKATEGSAEHLLAQAFIDPNEIKKERIEKGPWQKRWRRYEELVGSQFALWGLLLLGLVPAWVRAIRLRYWKSLPELPCRSLIFASAIFPLLVFLAVAWVSKVEANWPAVYMIGAAALFTPPLDKFRKYLYVGAGLNIVLVVIYAVHSSMPFLPIHPNKDRILRDTAGYAEVSDYIAKISDLVFFDTYQTGSMLAIYQPDLRTAQWPGITRSSEFLRRDALKIAGLQDIQERNDFWLITNNRIPPVLSGFIPVEEQMLVYCADKGLVAVHSSAESFVHPCSESKVRSWYFVKYNQPG